MLPGTPSDCAQEDERLGCRARRVRGVSPRRAPASTALVDWLPLGGRPVAILAQTVQRQARVFDVGFLDVDGVEWRPRTAKVAPSQQAHAVGEHARGFIECRLCGKTTREKAQLIVTVRMSLLLSTHLDRLLHKVGWPSCTFCTRWPGDLRRPQIAIASQSVPTASQYAFVHKHGLLVVHWDDRRTSQGGAAERRRAKNG